MKIGRIGWLDCAAGASGDMFLGALHDVGVPVQTMQRAVDGLPVPPVRLTAEPAVRHGIGGTRVRVESVGDDRPRNWREIRSVLASADLSDRVRSAAIATFGRLAEAEAAVHRVPIDEVHFHEVGGLDAIADIVGACAGLAHLGLVSLAASPVSVGSTPPAAPVRGLHGVVPIPAPATLELLRSAGAVVGSGPAPYEMCTPTGAALLAAHVDDWTALPPMRVIATGNGAGGRDVPEIPNMLRLVIGEPVGRTDDDPPRATLMETNVDDLDPRIWPTVLARLLAAGAADAWLSPILMKKGRPAHTLHVLCGPDRLTDVRGTILTETSTIGLREHRVDKHALDRRHHQVVIDGEPVKVKVAGDGGTVLNVSVEYDDVLAAAERLDRPVKEILARATGLAERFRGTTGPTDGPAGSGGSAGSDFGEEAQRTDH